MNVAKTKFIRIAASGPVGPVISKFGGKTESQTFECMHNYLKFVVFLGSAIT